MLYHALMKSLLLKLRAEDHWWMVDYAQISYSHCKAPDVLQKGKLNLVQM